MQSAMNISMMDLSNEDMFADQSATVMLKMPNPLFGMGDKGKIEIRCLCNKKMKDRAGLLVCMTGKCKLQIDLRSFRFMRARKYFINQDLKLRVPVCECCAHSKLFCTTNEKWSNFGVPKWTCNCAKQPGGGKMYVNVIDTYKGDMTQYNADWNASAIEEAANSNGVMSEESKEDYLKSLQQMGIDIDY